MGEKTIKALVEGGKASAGPPIGPALAPMKLNIGEVVAKINEATKAFAGIKVPVSIIVDTSTKEYRLEVGAPATSEMIKKEMGIEKGAGNREAPAGDIALEKIVSIAKKKQGGNFGKSLKDIVKEVIGTCESMGVTVNGIKPKEITAEINEGKHDSIIK
ncbi:50S ribosomal protein L11 [Candidatus Micrarchaeota archaeon]|nr:50S ribosomal protein L11 [Candidatus Micrarchaeota archaeon]